MVASVLTLEALFDARRCTMVTAEDLFALATFPSTTSVIDPICTEAGYSTSTRSVIGCLQRRSQSRLRTTLPIGLMLFERWDNIATLCAYQGGVDIYGATEDILILIQHAKALADALKGSHFQGIPGGHNEWAKRTCVDLH